MLLKLAVIALATSATRISANEAVCKNLVDGAKLEFADPMAASQAVKAGGRLELVCTVLAAPTASIVWLHEGKEVAVHEGPKDHLLSSGKRLGISMLESRLVRECVTAEDAGQYTCVAMSPCTKGIKQSTTVAVEGKAPAACPADIEPRPYIPLHTYSRMELPTVPVQLVCRSSDLVLGPRWVRVNDDDSTSEIGFAASGFMHLPSGDLIVDPQALAAEDGEEVVSVTMRCYVGAKHIDSSVIFMDEE